MSEKVNQEEIKEVDERGELSTPNVEYSIIKVDDQLLSIEGANYKLQKNYQNAFDLAQFKERYTDLFEKFDYIVGDLGYDQLRLRGFYRDDTKGVPLDMRISTLEDYLIEYCNFGCAYFVLERQDEKSVFPNYRRRDRLKNQGNRKTQKSRGKRQTQTQPGKTRKPAERKVTKRKFEKNQNKSKQQESQSDKKDEIRVKEVQDGTGKKRFQIKKKKQEDDLINL